MKKFAAYILVFLPYMVFGQLLPKVPDFKGNIRKVTEKKFGKEIYSQKEDSGVFKPGKYSGWKYIYSFGENSKLAERTSYFQDKVNAAFLYQRELTTNKITEREITRDNIHGQQGDYVEYENITDSKGQIIKVNFWSFSAQKNVRELFFIETNAEYDNGKLISFNRYNVKGNGEVDGGEKCSLFYDDSGRLIRIERKDIELNLKTIIYYSYNSKGLVDRYSIDYLVGLRNDQNNQKQDIFFKYDRHGNWIKRYYRISAKKKGLEAKRKIKYH